MTAVVRDYSLDEYEVDEDDIDPGPDMRLEIEHNGRVVRVSTWRNLPVGWGVSWDVNSDAMAPEFTDPKDDEAVAACAIIFRRTQEAAFTDTEDDGVFRLERVTYPFSPPWYRHFVGV